SVASMIAGSGSPSSTFRSRSAPSARPTSMRRRSTFVPTIATFPAPPARHICTAKRPIGPGPITTTGSPGWRSLFTMMALYTTYLAPNLAHRAAELVAHNDRRVDVIADVVPPLLHIRAAHPGGSHLEQHICRTDFGRGHLPQLDLPVTGAVFYNRLHRLS